MNKIYLKEKFYRFGKPSICKNTFNLIFNITVCEEYLKDFDVYEYKILPDISEYILLDTRLYGIEPIEDFLFHKGNIKINNLIDDKLVRLNLYNRSYKIRFYIEITSIK